MECLSLGLGNLLVVADLLQVDCERGVGGGDALQMEFVLPLFIMFMLLSFMVVALLLFALFVFVLFVVLLLFMVMFMLFALFMFMFILLLLSLLYDIVGRLDDDDGVGLGCVSIDDVVGMHDELGRVRLTVDDAGTFVVDGFNRFFDGPPLLATFECRCCCCFCFCCDGGGGGGAGGGVGAGVSVSELACVDEGVV